MYKLGKECVNVTDIVSEMNIAIKYIDNGQYDNADKLLNKIDSQVTHLEDISGNILFWSNFWRYFTVAVLLSIPVLTYFILPRLYITIWYRLRRRWIAKR